MNKNRKAKPVPKPEEKAKPGLQHVLEKE